MSLVTENLGPLVVIVAVLLGGCAFRALDRFEARRSAPARSGRLRGSGPRPHSHAPASLTEWVALGMREGWEAQGSTRRWQ